jgi:hypothetical protein
MRFPTPTRGVRPPPEQWVDRPEVYSSNAQPTGTNRPRACPTHTTPHQPHNPKQGDAGNSAKSHHGDQGDQVTTGDRHPQRNTHRHTVRQSSAPEFSTRTQIHPRPLDTSQPTHPHPEHPNTRTPEHRATRTQGDIGAHGDHTSEELVDNVTAAIANGKHPDPSRTRKLSRSAPMVLHPRGCGRVGRRRTSLRSRATRTGWPSIAFRGLCA